MDREESLIFQLDRLHGCWREEVSEELVRKARKDAIVLWPDGAPGARGNAPADVPLLYPVLPAPGKATGAAVIVCPGGGFRSHVPWEAFPFAEWFSEQGITSFVLQYRLLPYTMPAMLDDGMQAVRLVRSRAAEFGVDPGRIGMIGFSAGGSRDSGSGSTRQFLAECGNAVLSRRRYPYFAAPCALATR
jgi:acetyl esterase/lipase